MPREITEEFLWGPPISRGQYLESQRILWQSTEFTGRTGDVQDWSVSTSAFSGPELQRVQSLVFAPAASGPIVALRWAVPRSRPGWLAHGAALPADATAWDALAVGSVLRLADSDVESRYRNRVDALLRAPDSPPLPDPADLDLGAVWQLRNAIPVHAQFMLVGPDEATIRAHLAAALSITPATTARGVFFSTLESRVEAASPLRVVGVVESLWKGPAPDRAVRIGEGAGHPGWLAPALRSLTAREHLRTATADILSRREAELAGLFERGEASEDLLRRFLSRGDYRALDDAGVDPTGFALEALTREEPWTASLFTPAGRYRERLIPHLAATGAGHTDEYLRSVLAVLDDADAQMFWRSVAHQSQTRDEVHPGCHLRVCSLREGFDRAVAADSALGQELLHARPTLLPPELLPAEQVITDVLEGRRAPDDAGPLLRRTDAVDAVCRAVHSALRTGHCEPEALAGRLLQLVDPDPALEQRIHRLLLAQPATYDFAVGPYLHALSRSKPPADRRGEILSRLFHEESHAFAASGVPAVVSTYVRADTPVLMPVGGDDLLRQILRRRPAADAFLGGVLPSVDPGDAHDVVLRFWPEIARTYGLPSPVDPDGGEVSAARPAHNPPTAGGVVVAGAAEGPQTPSRRIVPWVVAAAGVIAAVFAFLVISGPPGGSPTAPQPTPAFIGPTPIGEGAGAGAWAPVGEAPGSRGPGEGGQP